VHNAGVTAEAEHPQLLVVAGEASGDMHGARLLTELRRLVPGVAAFGLGGSELRDAGLEAVADSSEVAVVGIVEVLKVLPRIREVFAALLAEVDRRRPRAAVLIDFPDFNLRLARQLKRRGIPVIYYISPQVWAWRRGRVKTIARRVDAMLVLFPFEVDFYRRSGVQAVHVGHPLVDEVPQLASAWETGEPGEPGGPAEGGGLGLPGGVAGPVRLALLPGSRRGEIEALLPVMLAAVERLAAEVAVEVALIRAPTIPEALLAGHLERFRGRSGGATGERGSADFAVRVVSLDRFAVIAAAHLALCASGTATLEVGLLGTPMIVLYKLARWTYVLARLLVRLPNFALVNLVLGREVVPELLQGEAEPERIAAEALRLLRDRDARARLRTGLADLRPRLGEGGASLRAARQVAGWLEGGANPSAPASPLGSLLRDRRRQNELVSLREASA
jgi:lipid-A-disaccharide synthase